MPGNSLLTEPAEDFLSMELETSLLADLDKISKAVPNPTVSQRLSMTVGSMVVTHQHALRLVRSDLCALHTSLSNISEQISSKTSILDKSVNTVATSVNIVSANQVDDC